MKFVLRIDDVGRKPGDDPDHGTDNDLDYFFRWRAAAGLAGLPVFYGAVPAWVSEKGIQRLRDVLDGDERTAIHGWDHVKNRVVTLEQMKEARKRFQNTGSLAYIPPRNHFDNTTMNTWRQAGGQVFFGGLTTGEAKPPRIERELIYLPAHGPLYDHVEGILDNLQTVPFHEVEFPLVVTLHVPWDTEEKWPLVARLVRVLSKRLVDYVQLSKDLSYHGS